MIFKTIVEETISTSSIDVKIANLETSLYHWRGGKNIFALAEQLELLYIQYPDDDVLNKKIINLFLEICKENRRIEKIEFFKDIILIVSDITTFKEENFLKRTIEINCKKQGKKLTIFEITSKEYSKEKLPEEWQPNEELTKTFNRYQALFLS